MKETGKLVYSVHVVEFTAMATEYCKYAEHASELKGSELLNIMQRFLPLLYHKAAMLPHTEPFFEDGNEKFVTEQDWNNIHEKFKTAFGSANDYLELLDDPASGDEGTIAAEIAEDLSDVYQDMKNFVLLYQTGTEEVMNDAIWECRLNFENYWGVRLLNSLRAIHRFLVSGKETDEPGEEVRNEEEKNHTDWFISKRQREFRGGNEN
ncbi:MAG TPA: DUF5063 domain-containing protein [Bacteroidales bacterium]|nr:DUF5063 domain-containing protein [Bacteroidales bacterium]